MAKYTISIRELLQFYGKQDGLSIYNNIPNILTLSKKYIFGDELNLIDENVRDDFAVGFCLHFFNDEIGLETFELWRMALIEKMYNNHDYINYLYTQLDKGVFQEYHITKYLRKQIIIVTILLTKQKILIKYLMVQKKKITQ